MPWPVPLLPQNQHFACSARLATLPGIALGRGSHPRFDSSVPLGGLKLLRGAQGILALKRGAERFEGEGHQDRESGVCRESSAARIVPQEREPDPPVVGNCSPMLAAPERALGRLRRPDWRAAMRALSLALNSSWVARSAALIPRGPGLNSVVPSPDRSSVLRAINEPGFEFLTPIENSSAYAFARVTLRMLPSFESFRAASRNFSRARSNSPRRA